MDLGICATHSVGNFYKIDTFMQWKLLNGMKEEKHKIIPVYPLI